MSYSYINVWRDGVPHVAYEIPDHVLIGEWWAPPHRVTPDPDGTPSEPDPISWKSFFGALVCYQRHARFEVSESYRPWQRGWDVPPVKP